MRPNSTTLSGSAVETRTARLAPIARWSAFSLSIQAGCQCRVFLISQTIVPHTRRARSRTSCTRSAPRAPFATGRIASCGKRRASSASMSISNTSPWRSCEPCSLLRRASSSALRRSSISLSFSLSLRSCCSARRCFSPSTPARHFEVELAGAGFERRSFLAQFELGLLRLPAPAALLGELAFEELLFDSEIRPRLLLGLAGENLQARLVLVAKLLLERLAERDLGAAAGTGDHGRVHGRLFTAGRINAPCSQACGDRDRLRRQVQPEIGPHPALPGTPGREGVAAIGSKATSGGRRGGEARKPGSGDPGARAKTKTKAATSRGCMAANLADLSPGINREHQTASLPPSLLGIGRGAEAFRGASQMLLCSV